MSSLLFESPCQLGALSLPNRLVMAPMSRYFCPDGLPHDEVVQYYARRAQAGVGLIISEGTFINHATAAGYDNVPVFFGEALAEWTLVIDAVHEAGGKMFPQLWHVGSYHQPGKGWDADAPAFSPSGVPNEVMKTQPQAMSQADIDAVVAAYAQAAQDAERLGFDGIEIHAAHGYLIDEFFWSRTNVREDRYGGGIAQRNQFALEILAAIRAVVSPEFPICLRVSQWKQQDYNATMVSNDDELAQWLCPLAEAGVDIFHVSTRRFWQPAFANSDEILAAKVKRITGKPVIMVGSVGLDSASFEGAGVNDITAAEQQLANQNVDLIAVGRALLADPNWATKMHQQALETITPYSITQLKTLI